MWDFIRISERTAAKVHACMECSKAIEVGERHVYSAGKVEGYFESYRLCLRCREFAQAYCEVFGDDEGWPVGALFSTLRDEEGIEDPDAWLADFKAKRDARNEAERAARVQREARLAHLDGVICAQCGATLQTYGDKCSAALDVRCPGFEVIERALAPTDAGVA